MYGVGLIGAVLAAEGLNRFGSFVAAVGGGDAPLYTGALLVALFDVGVLGAALLKKPVRSEVKWTAVALTVPAFLVLLLGPGLPVVVQAMLGTAAALVGLIALPTEAGRNATGAPELQP